VDEIIPEPVRFEWDEGNIDKSFEKRCLVLGKSENGKFLSITFTLRKGKVRIISSRPMSRKERRLYTEKS